MKISRAGLLVYSHSVPRGGRKEKMGSREGGSWGGLGGEGGKGKGKREKGKEKKGKGVGLGWVGGGGRKVKESYQ